MRMPLRPCNNLALATYKTERTHHLRAIEVRSSLKEAYTVIEGSSEAVNMKYHGHTHAR